jgi:superfamily I DNA/RNA helicase
MNNLSMIFGAPGCGKTTHLIKLLEDILTQYDPDKVAFVSFTKKGSYEGRDRAVERFGYKEKDLPFFRTIHSLAFRDLGMSRYDMVNHRHYREFSKAMGMNFLGYYTEDLVNNDDKYLAYCSLLKNNPAKAKEVEPTLDYAKAKMINRNYERYKQEVGIKDFDDLIVEFVRNDKPLPVKVAIIDEAQDLTSLQWKFCEVAFRDCDKVYIAGDDDQAIYEWSGADVHEFLHYKRNKGTDVSILNQSYRLRSDILEFSKSISSMIGERVDKKFNPIAPGGGIYYHSSVEEIPITNMESYYFLSRNRMFLRQYKEYLMNKGLVFYHKGESSVNLDMYEAIRRYERLRQSGATDLGKDMKLAPFLRKDRKEGDPWYLAFTMTPEVSKYYRDLFRNKTDVSKCNITVNTIHGVKGGEADNVIVYLGVTKRVYENFTLSRDALDSELRCLYVAVTRSKKNLHIIYPSTKFGYDDVLSNRRAYVGI